MLELVGLRGHGKTDLAAALRGARRELAPATADERVVVLLSDCLSTAGDAGRVGAGRHRPAARAVPAAHAARRWTPPACWPPAVAGGWSRCGP